MLRALHAFYMLHSRFFIIFFSPLAMILTKLAASGLNPNEISKYSRPARHGLDAQPGKVAQLPMAIGVKCGLFELV